jgi:hypothetical protein
LKGIWLAVDAGGWMRNVQYYAGLGRSKYPPRKLGINSHFGGCNSKRVVVDVFFGLIERGDEKKKETPFSARILTTLFHHKNTLFFGFCQKFSLRVTVSVTAGDFFWTSK